MAGTLALALALTLTLTLTLTLARTLTLTLSLSPSPSPSLSLRLTPSRSRWLAAAGPELSPTPPQPPAENVWQRLSKPARKYASVSPDTRVPERVAPDGGAETQRRPPPAEETLPKRTRQG